MGVLATVGCAPRVCVPSTCGPAQVCGLDGECAALPSQGPVEAPQSPPEPAAVEEPTFHRVRREVARWGSTNGGGDIVCLGDEGEGLYLAFEADADDEDSVLSLFLSQRAGITGPLTVVVEPVGPFDSEGGVLDGQRLPGLIGRGIGQVVGAADRLFFDVSAMAIRDDHRFLRIRGEGQGRACLQTPAATEGAARPTMLVTVVPPSLEADE